MVMAGNADLLSILLAQVLHLPQQVPTFSSLLKSSIEHAPLWIALLMSLSVTALQIQIYIFSVNANENSYHYSIIKFKVNHFKKKEENMKVENNINQTLNGVLKESLTMINQYFLHARMLNDWGFDELGGKNYKFSIKAMKESDALIKRILFLEGLPNLQNLGRLSIGEDVPEILDSNLAMEHQFRSVLQSSIAQSESERDYITRNHLKNCLDKCEQRLDYFETQISLLGTVGKQNYHQSIV